jgi:STAS-like domain of unknown function (DUF4325)
MIRPADDLGAVLSGRFEAEELRGRIESAAREHEVIVSFKGVEAMSPSFADELFAKFPRDLLESGQVRFRDLDQDLKVLARFVKEGRD